MSIKEKSKYKIAQFSTGRNAAGYLPNCLTMTRDSKSEPEPISSVN